MTYYVVAPDGQKYGPGDVVTLNQWAQQGRVLPTTVLEDASTGARFAASQVPGMTFAPAPANDFAQPPSYQQYPRMGYGVSDNGDSDYQKALIFGILGLLCCPLIFSSIGIYFASLGVIAAALVYEHLEARRGDVASVNRAFFQANAVVGAAFVAGTFFDHFAIA